VGVSEVDLLNEAREKARTLGADAIVKTALDEVHYRPLVVYDPWYDPVFYGYYRYRPFPPFPQPWVGPYRYVGGGVSFTLKAMAIKYHPVAGQADGAPLR
jgi:hypothetical protein